MLLLPAPSATGCTCMNDQALQHEWVTPVHCHLGCCGASNLVLLQGMQLQAGRAPTQRACRFPVHRPLERLLQPKVRPCGIVVTACVPAEDRSSQQDDGVMQGTSTRVHGKPAAGRSGNRIGQVLRHQCSTHLHRQSVTPQAACPVPVLRLIHSHCCLPALSLPTCTVAMSGHQAHGQHASAQCPMHLRTFQ